MSTPFPPRSKLKGLSAYAPPRVRDRALSQDPPAETADTSVQGEQMTSEAEQAGRDPTPTVEDAGPANKSGTAKDALDWLDDAIREIVELNHAPADHDESDAPFAAPYSPSITPMHDESDENAPSNARRQDRAKTQTVLRPRPPRLETQILPPPPFPTRERSQLGQILRMSLAIIFAAIVAYAVTRFYSSWSGTPPLKNSIDHIAEATPQPTATPHPTQTPATPQTPSRLVVENEQAFANDPMSLALSVEHAMGNESLLLDGLAQGTTLSAGTSISPSSWQLQPDKLAGLYLYAPKDFVGVMNTTVKLLDPGKRVLGSRDMQLKWISRPAPQLPEPAVASAGNEAPAGVRIGPARPEVTPEPPPVRAIDPSEAAMLMQRGRDFLATGDLSAARVAFRRLADAGMPDAALALAGTYDPAYLAAHNFVGVLGDRAMARTLYRRARDLGSKEAGQILARMGAN